MSHGEVMSRLRGAGPRAYATVVVTTLRDNGGASYLSGRLRLRGDALTTSDGPALRQLFSDRTVQLAGSSQPFSISSPDWTGLDIVPVPGLAARAVFTLHTWGGGQFSVDLHGSGKMLVGLGPREGGGAYSIEYAITFPEVYG